MGTEVLLIQLLQLQIYWPAVSNILAQPVITLRDLIHANVD